MVLLNYEEDDVYKMSCAGLDMSTPAMGSRPKPGMAIHFMVMYLIGVT